MSKEAQKPLNLKSKFVELSSGWTAHGYHNIYRSEHWPVRLMWILIFLLASILCGYMVYKSITDYLQYDVVTKIRDYSQVPANYPVITFCNINPLIKNSSDSLIKDLLDKEFNISYIEQDYFLNQTLSNSTSSLSYKVLTSYEKLMSAKTSSINKAMDPAYGDANRQSLWYNLDQLLIYCKYNGKLCNQSDFAWLFMYEYGNCFQFNTGKEAPIKKIQLDEKKRMFNFNRGVIRSPMACICRLIMKEFRFGRKLTASQIIKYEHALEISEYLVQDWNQSLVEASKNSNIEIVRLMIDGGASLYLIIQAYVQLLKMVI